MTGTELVALHFGKIPGLAYLQAMGTKVLGLALLVWLLIELYAFLTRGSCDFATPIVRVGLAIAVVQSLPMIGSVLGGLSEDVSKAMLDASSTEFSLFSEAFNHAVVQVYAKSTWDQIASAFSFKGIMVMFACGLYLAMMIVKILVIDVLWPVVFSVVLVLGGVAVPLGALPGGSVGGWFRALLEVSLWPLIFQLLLAMMVGTLKGMLHEVVNVDFGTIFGQGIALGPPDAATAASASASIIVLLRFWALCLGYCLLGLGTPVVTRVALGAAPVGALMGQLTRFASASLGQGKASVMARIPGAAAVLGGSEALASAVGNAGGGSAVSSASVRVQGVKTDSATPSPPMDEREHRTSGEGRWAS